MNFTVRSLILLVTAFAPLCAITVRYPPIGVALCSVVPLLLFLCFCWKGTANRNRFSRLTLTFWLALPVYVALIGPYSMAKAYYAFVTPGRPLAVGLRLCDLAYAPLGPWSETGLLGWYVGEWGAYGIDAVFGPIFDELESYLDETLGIAPFPMDRRSDCGAIVRWPIIRA